MSVNPVFPVTFAGGQMTDLPVFSGTFDGTELFEVVAPGNEANGVNYRITSALLASLLTAVSSQPVILQSGQFNAPGNPYIVPITVTKVYVNKTPGEPTYIRFLAAAGYLADILVCDIAGTADVGNITVTFTSGELANGIAPIPIATAYGGFFFRPVTTLAKWILGVA